MKHLAAYSLLVLAGNAAPSKCLEPMGTRAFASPDLPPHSYIYVFAFDSRCSG